jgi:RNA polymerase sigma-70 factor (ECF subfamily)
VDIRREQQLIKAAQTGDQPAFEALYEAYIDKIFRYIFFRVENEDTANDLTSEVFLRMVEALPTYEDRGIPLLVWLYKIAQARIIDHYRKNRSVKLNVHELQLLTEDDMDNELMTAYHQQSLQVALRTLTSEQQQVILLRFVENYNLQQTADILGKTVGAIKVMQHRAIQALSQALQRQNVVSNES